MGRQEHLQRLAFGRSAFQDLSEQDQDAIAHLSSNDQATSSENKHIQLYDSKGRPRNPRTEDLNARLRHAQNEALALVGVVERKESADADAQLEATLARGVREHMLTHENAHGEELESATEISSFFVAWWPQTLLKRIHIGLYGPDLSFAGILALRWIDLRGPGLRGVLRGLLPGCAVSVMHRVIYQCLGAAVEEAISWLQQRLIKSGYRRRKSARLHAALNTLCEVVLLSLDLAIVPLDMYAFALQLGIAPLDTPWRTTTGTLLPSFFRYTYANIFASPTAFLTSPAALLIFHNLITRDDSQAEYETPYFASLTSYRLPSAVSDKNVRREIGKRPPFLRDPFGATLAAVFNVRTEILVKLGWNAIPSSLPHSSYVADRQIVYDNANDIAHVDANGAMRPGSRLTEHRSTALARLPVFWLARSIDAFAVRLLLLPFEGLVMNRIASFYLASPMPVTAAGAALGLRPAVPGLLRLLLHPSSGGDGWRAVGQHLSHLGLGLATSLVFEAACFAALYRVVRRQGIRHYQWGQKERLAEHEIDDER